MTVARGFHNAGSVVNSMDNLTHPQQKWMVGLGLVIAILLAYGQLINADFIPYDDQSYVTENSIVQRGMTMSGIRWAFADIHTGYWHPLTWLSLMLDYDLYGLHAGGYHWTNVILHITTTLLLFLALTRLTGSLWRSGAVAALFALHPSHVESVAWIAERKDVLSACFWMLTMFGYAYYAERPGGYRYLLVLLPYGLGLLSKPMLVTLPFVLLLLDYWPLRRIPAFGVNDARRGPRFGRLLLEKVPLLILAAGSSAGTYLSARKAGALASLDALSLPERLANTLVSYTLYLGKLIWPADLAVFYPHPGTWPPGQIASSLLLILLLSILAVRWIYQFPYVLTGWLWFLGTLIPVIGIVQAGAQAMSDRYTYIPFIGLFIVAAWGLPDTLSRWRYRRIGISVISLLLLSLMSVGTWHQITYWQNGHSLFSHTLAATRDNYVGHSAMGAVFLKENRYEEAIQQYQRAVKIQPRYEPAWCGLGTALQKQGRDDEALSIFLHALTIDPGFAGAHYALGKAYTRSGRYDEAVFHFRTVLQFRPDEALIFSDLGTALTHAGKIEEALACYHEAVRLQPDHAGYHNNLGMALVQAERVEEAEEEFRSALRLEPGYANAHYRLSLLLRERGLTAEADRHHAEALRINPDYGEGVRVRRR
jgi:protein O-mannosyl-transferase